MTNEHSTGQLVTSAAEIYDCFFVPALFAEWPPRLIDAVGMQPAERVLDVACGSGVLTKAVLERVGPAGSVTGLDINPGMLAVAAANCPAATWQLGPAESLPFEDGQFDRVVSQFGLMFFTDQRKALAEMKRVTRPGGRMAVAVWGTLAKTPGYAAVADMLDTLFGPQIAESIEAPYSLGDLNKVLTLFAEAGIGNPTIQTIAGTARFSSIESWLYTDIKGWTLADVIDEAQYKRLSQEAPRWLGRFAAADGTVAFDAPAHIISVGC